MTEIQRFRHLPERHFSSRQIGWIVLGASVVWAGLWVVLMLLFRFMDFLESNPVTQEIPIAQPFVFAGILSCFGIALALPGLVLWLSQRQLPPNASQKYRLGVGIIAFLGPVGGGLGLLWLLDLFYPWVGKDMLRLLNMRTATGFLVSAWMISVAIRSFLEKREGSLQDIPK
ncbi:hypothetical protein D6833_10570 [Candidatus Parcubacteria bacterium]|nr:MAG: hypothetical protein D6833_10570 [Candidatus Parcubacteria bacterium]